MCNLFRLTSRSATESHQLQVIKLLTNHSISDIHGSLPIAYVNKPVLPCRFDDGLNSVKDKALLVLHVAEDGFLHRLYPLNYLSVEINTAKFWPWVTDIKNVYMHQMYILRLISTNFFYRAIYFLPSISFVWWDMNRKRFEWALRRRKKRSQKVDCVIKIASGNHPLAVAHISVNEDPSSPLSGVYKFVCLQLCFKFRF